MLRLGVGILDSQRPEEEAQGDHLLLAELVIGTVHLYGPYSFLLVAVSTSSGERMKLEQE